MNFDNFIAKYVNVEDIGGFCIDLAHFKAGVTKQTREYHYTLKKMGRVKIACNHLSGYSFNSNKDLHTIESISHFDYLKTLPSNIFGQVIAIEVFNSIKEQLKYQKHLRKLLRKRFGFKIV